MKTAILSLLMLAFANANAAVVGDMASKSVSQGQISVFPNATALELQIASKNAKEFILKATMFTSNCSIQTLTQDSSSQEQMNATITLLKGTSELKGTTVVTDHFVMDMVNGSHKRCHTERREALEVSLPSALPTLRTTVVTELTATGGDHAECDAALREFRR